MWQPYLLILVKSRRVQKSPFVHWLTFKDSPTTTCQKGSVVELWIYKVQELVGSNPTKDYFFMVRYFAKVFCQRTNRWRLFCRTIDSSIKRHSLANDLLSLNQLISFVLNIWLCHFALEWKGYSISPLTSNRVGNIRCYQAVLMSEICTTRFTMEIHFVTLHRHFEQKNS